MPASGITLSRHIIEEEHRHPQTTGEFSILLQQMSYAGRVLANEIRKAAMGTNLGSTGRIGPSGDTQSQIDVFANEVVCDAFERSRLVAGLVSEELEDAAELNVHEDARYLLCIDPIDGSQNAEVNAPMGTIFGLFRRSETGAALSVSDFMRPARDLVAAGYLLYGPSTTLVYTSGAGVHGFTLDQSVGEFMLTNPNLKCPTDGRTISINVGRYHEWDEPVQRFVDDIHHEQQMYLFRYGGAPVTDVHRALTDGGVFIYPPDADYADGKLRLLYEAGPLAYIVEQAGGTAHTGTHRVIDVTPSGLHMSIPIAIGSTNLVERYVGYMT